MGRELARELPDARAVFQEADDVLGFALSELMWEGPEDALTETRNAQPAILVHSVAVHRAVADRLGDVAFAAGHSLGEFSAYVAAGALSFRDALDAVRLRGELMFSAGEERPGTMAAILGLDDAAVEEVCAGVEAGLCVPANFNSAGQVVVSGDRVGVARAMERAENAGAKRVVALKVSGAFHSPLMEPAETGLEAKLREIPFSDPAFPVVANVTASPVTDGEEARRLLLHQLTSPVRWAASVRTMLEGGARRFAELGPGRVLCGLNRRNAPRGMPCDSLGTPADLAEFVHG
jgi:[acyl-carrier-protein] S-malonyltransferase